MLHIAMLPAEGHDERLNWIKEYCLSFFEYEYISSHWGIGKIIYRFRDEQDVTLFLLKWK